MAFRPGVEGGFVRERTDLAVAALGFPVDITMIDDLIFVQRRRGDEHGEIMAPARIDFGFGDCVKLRNGSVSPASWYAPRRGSAIGRSSC